MISAAVIEALKEIVPAERILFQEPMKLHTTFRIGGPADYLIYLENTEVSAPGGCAIHGHR